MRIGIVTQPLGHNYGGILQNYALQQVLKRLGHEPITIDYHIKLTWTRFLLSTIKSSLLYFLPGRRRKFADFPKMHERNTITNSFVEKRIAITRPVCSYGLFLPIKYRLGCVITGSDQVWRPRYNEYLKDMYLRFVKGRKRLKIAYAASFGVDEWEYSDELTRQCRTLAQRLDAVSVREKSGIKLCKNYLDVNAVEVLDPTLLLSADDYAALCHNVKPADEPYIAAYVLDVDEHKQKILEDFASKRNLPLRLFTAHKGLTLTVEQWLAMFRDASYVITDSFHGTVFSIINHKNFISIANIDRGASRFESLLGKFGLQNRLVSSFDLVTDVPDIDWAPVDARLAQWQEKSIDFLKTSLNHKRK